MKAEYPYFTDLKFFTPLYLHLKVPHKIGVLKQLFHAKSLMPKKGGKKLVKGVKNF